MCFRKLVLKMPRLLVIATAFLVLTASGAPANLIVNPSFETQYSGWDYSNVDWWTGWTAKDGAVSIDISGGGAGWISQSFPTAIGNRYEVTFWLAGNPQGPPTVKTMKVSSGDVSGLQYTFDVTGYNTSNMGWTEKSFLFNATGASTTLKFESLDNTFYGPAIDLVSVELAPAPVPASLWLLGSGLVGLLGLGRKFRKS